MRNIALAGLVLAAADYAMQRRRVGKQTRMSKEEVKQEHKQSEGDPMLKGAIRARQLAASRNRMIADVATADVVLVNPTHVAVALRYESELGAPRRRGPRRRRDRRQDPGAGRRGAGPAGPRHPARPGALLLHATSARTIPNELFAAVATVLAFVISRRTAGQHGGEHRSPRQESRAARRTGHRTSSPDSLNCRPAAGR